MSVEYSVMADSSLDEQRLSFGDHLEELRYRIILVLVGVCATAVGSLWFGKQLVAWLCQPLAHAQRSAHVPTGIYTLSPIAGFAVYLKVSLVAAVILASPWALYQMWRFLESGLYPRERRVVLLLAPFSAVMTAFGLLFLYYIMLPVCLWFLIAFANSYPMADVTESSLVLGVLSAEPDRSHGQQTTPGTDVPVAVPVLIQNPLDPVDGQMWFNRSRSELNFHLDGETRTVPLRSSTLISPMIEIGQYISFAIVLAIGIVAAFQLPVVMLIMGWWSLIDPKWLAAYRKHCVLICFAVGMLLTPSDVLSMMLLAIPLWGLFEFGLLLMRATYKRGG